MKKDNTPPAPGFKKYRSHGEPLPPLKPIDYGESQTVPGQALSVREILHRYTTGQSLSVNNNTPVYLENVPLYDLRRKSNIDIARDRHNLELEIEQTQHEYNETVAKLTEHKSKKAKAAAEAAQAANQATTAAARNTVSGNGNQSPTN